MSNEPNIFSGCIPALMTPCDAAGEPRFEALVAKGRELIDVGMRGVVYCGSMGDWPLLTDAHRQEGVRRGTSKKFQSCHYCGGNLDKRFLTTFYFIFGGL